MLVALSCFIECCTCDVARSKRGTGKQRERWKKVGKKAGRLGKEYQFLQNPTDYIKLFLASTIAEA